MMLALGLLLLFSCSENNPSTEVEKNNEPSHSEIISDMLNRESRPEDYVEVKMMKLPMFAINENDPEGENFVIVRMEEINAKPRYKSKGIIEATFDFHISDNLDNRIYTLNNKIQRFDPPIGGNIQYVDLEFSNQFDKSTYEYDDIMSMFGRDDLNVRADIRSIVFTDSTTIKDEY